jgi:hypothetical protein
MPRKSKTAEEKKLALHERRVRRTGYRQDWQLLVNSWVDNEGVDRGHYWWEDDNGPICSSCSSLTELGDWMEGQGYELKLDKEL